MSRARTYSPPHGPDAMDRLRELTEQDGHPQADIATGAGMSRAQLSQILTGHRRNPSVGTVARVLAALGCTWADLDGP